jgi:hypothetical protein
MTRRKAKITSRTTIIALVLAAVTLLSAQEVFAGCIPPDYYWWFNNEDFNGDLYSDMAFYGNGQWRVRDSVTGVIETKPQGLPGDIPVSDTWAVGITSQQGVWRPSTGDWYAPEGPIHFGLNGDKPVNADYDRDCKADLAVFRQGDWWILKSSDGTVRIDQWGTSGDIPVPGHWGFINEPWVALGVYRPSNSTWYLRKFNTTESLAYQFGTTGDLPVPGVYNGSSSGGLTFAVFRPSDRTWWIYLDYPEVRIISFEFGLSTDIPVPGDYDGNASGTNVAVYRPSNGVWYYLDDNYGQTVEVYFPGNAGEQPVPGFRYRY